MERSLEALLRGELARGDITLRGIAPVLGHMLAGTGQSLVTEEIVARVRGMVEHLSEQLVAILGAEQNLNSKAERDAIVERYAIHLSQTSSVLSHCYCVAMEALLTKEMEERLAVDQSLSNLFQELVGSDDPAVAELSMTALAAQSRFVQNQRKGDLPIGELPAELFHVLATRWPDFPGYDDKEAVKSAANSLKADYDEGASRIGLLGRVIAAMRGASRVALDLEHAGLALFASALAATTRQPRELAVLSTHETQIARLVLGLRAAELSDQEIEKQVRLLHPDLIIPVDFSAILPKEAQSILRNSDTRSGR